MRETPIVRARSGLVPTLGGSSSKTPRKREAAAVVTRVASSSQPSWRIGGTFKRIKAGFLVSVKIEVPEPQLESASISRSHCYITGTLCTARFSSSCPQIQIPASALHGSSSCRRGRGRPSKGPKSACRRLNWACGSYSILRPRCFGA